MIAHLVRSSHIVATGPERRDARAKGFVRKREDEDSWHMSSLVRRQVTESIDLSHPVRVIIMVSMPELSASDDPTADFPTIPQRLVRMHVITAGGTHPGWVRERNEDQFLIAKLAKSMRICASSLPESETTRFSDEEGYLMIVADGMGGSAGGVEASSMAVRTVESFVLDAVKWFLHGKGSEQNSCLAASCGWLWSARTPIFLPGRKMNRDSRVWARP